MKTVLVFLGFFFSSLGFSQALNLEHIDAYFSQENIWHTHHIPVCWENPSDDFTDEMNAVQSAIENSWAANSRLTFEGWEACDEDSEGIRILIDDSQAKTRGIGTRINGVENGMVLNFTFENWSTKCQKHPMDCIRGIAIHEFGHAIGFAHEQNRPDAPEECHERSQGHDGDIMLTNYDPYSVMNYCNPVYNNGGVLSQGDIAGVQEMYGAP